MTLKNNNKNNNNKNNNNNMEKKASLRTATRSVAVKQEKPGFSMGLR